MKKLSFLLTVILIFCVTLTGCGDTAPASSNADLPEGYIAGVNFVPDFSDSPFVAIKDNVPDFTEAQLKPESFETYSNLDILGRCGVAFACVGKDLMPTEERESIGQVKPSGWKTVKYDIVDGKYLYNRCHLIGFQLTGENANEKNLITGTRYMNVEGMLPFENLIADYVKETENHVLYRVTPVYDGTNLVARGVQLEAMSVEDRGEGVCFNVYVYNNQPGITINYATGDSALSGQDISSSSQESAATHGTQYVLNTSSKKFHLPTCSGAKSIKESNKETCTGTAEELIKQGYSPCKTCID